MDQAPKEPDPPEKPKTTLERLKKGVTEFREPPWRQLAIPDIGTPFESSFELSGSRETGFAVQLSIPRLIHHRAEEFGDFYSMFRRREDVCPFEAEVVITASNIPSKIESTVPFLLGLDDAQ